MVSDKLIAEPSSGRSMLDAISLPADLRALPESALPMVADALREEIIETVAVTGGHLGASLGVVELTVALHYVFDTPHDRLIWDVGHQSYPHKRLTGRRDRMKTLRQGGGLSGFPRRSESDYDAFGTAHSSTSISAALGISVASMHQGVARRAIAVIGDGAMSAGMAYEAMNNAGYLNQPLIVILNDNDMSIAPPVGAMSAYLSRLVSSRPYHKLRALAKDVMRRFPRRVEAFARRAEEYARGIITGGTLFEELGFFYIGPVDGHNLNHLLPILKNVRDNPGDGPILIHVVTQKGRGYAPAEAAPDKLHATATFDVKSGAPKKSSSSAATYTQVFANSLIREARMDPDVVAITAAMPSGTGLDAFAEVFPKRCYDVGIAEQHAVTFAAGLAAEGMKPFVALYSTFLQRAYDQVIHDVAIQKLPVRLMIDRAGLVGADGATHAGSFDLAYLGCVPNMVLMAPADATELSRMVASARLYDQGPVAVRFPRGAAYGSLDAATADCPLVIGQGRILREGQDVAIMSCGARLHACLDAADKLAQMSIDVTVADARFAKPLDEALLRQLANHHKVLLIVEDGAIGGFAAHVLDRLANWGILDKGLIVRTMLLPDVFIDHDTPELQYTQAKISTDHIMSCVLQHCNHRQVLNKKTI